MRNEAFFVAWNEDKARDFMFEGHCGIVGVVKASFNGFVCDFYPHKGDCEIQSWVPIGELELPYSAHDLIVELSAKNIFSLLNKERIQYLLAHHKAELSAIHIPSDLGGQNDSANEG